MSTFFLQCKSLKYGDILLAVCGDSFTSIDSRFESGIQWPYLLGQKLNTPTICFGRGGADSLYIHSQVKYAIDHFSPEYMLVWCTSPDRFMFPIDSSKELGDLTANKVKSHFGFYNKQGVFTNFEKNFVYDDYEELYGSDHVSSFSERNDVSDKFKQAFDMHLTHLYAGGINQYIKKMSVEHIYFLCDSLKIKTVIVDTYQTNPTNYEYNLPQSNFVEIISLDFDIGSGSDMSNHISLENHQSLADYLYTFYK